MNTTILFNKYQGTGNDFILIDNRDEQYNALTSAQIAHLCDRRFGIGADGLMLLSSYEDCDFFMSYYNSSGLSGTMCGNGGRCISAFARDLGIVDKNIKFWASDGLHTANIISRHHNQSLVRLKMKEVCNYSYLKDEAIFLIDTGSPHYIKFVEEVDNIDVVNDGRNIRFLPDFPLGLNVNFVEFTPKGLKVRTYERGVEDETFSCGTGATASAIASVLHTHISKESLLGLHSVNIETKGGSLLVDFEINESRQNLQFNDLNSADFLTLNNNYTAIFDFDFSNIYLEGLTTFVYEGKISI